MSDHQPFIPAELDEAGLPANQFRVLCHLWRRGETYSNAATIAKVCRLKRDTVFECLAELERGGYINRTPRPGQTTIIQPAPIRGTGKDINPPRLGGQEVSRSGGQHPSRLGGHKGNPIKAIPRREESAPLALEIPDPLPFPSDAFRNAWSDWQQHRKEIKKPLTPTSTKQQLRNFAEMGEARSIAAIRHTIGNGWQGIREPDAPRGTAPPKPRDFRSDQVGI